MASPIKHGTSAILEMLDRRILDCQDSAGIEEAIKSRGYDIFDIRVLTVRFVKADKKANKYERLGMARIARMLGVSERSVYNWWDVYENRGGIDALRNNMWRPGRKPKVDPEVLHEVEVALLGRRMGAKGGKGRGAEGGGSGVGWY